MVNLLLITITLSYLWEKNKKSEKTHPIIEMMVLINKYIIIIYLLNVRLYYIYINIIYGIIINFTKTGHNLFY